MYTKKSAENMVCVHRTETRDGRFLRCVSARCMAWRWSDRWECPECGNVAIYEGNCPNGKHVPRAMAPRGYCGLAGLPT